MKLSAFLHACPACWHPWSHHARDGYCAGAPGGDECTCTATEPKP